MRELKFRAWDDVEKRMYYGNTEQFDDMLGFRFQHFETDKPVYMQYTGLKDKNGKEIYEGDLVLIGAYKTPVPVVYQKACFYTTIGESNYRLGGFHEEAIEIIGNIYESPELLKGEETR